MPLEESQEEENRLTFLKKELKMDYKILEDRLKHLEEENENLNSYFENLEIIHKNS